MRKHMAMLEHIFHPLACISFHTQQKTYILHARGGGEEEKGHCAPCHMTMSCNGEGSTYRHRGSIHPHSWIHSCWFPRSSGTQVCRMCTGHCGHPYTSHTASSTFYSAVYHHGRSQMDTQTRTSWGGGQIQQVIGRFCNVHIVQGYKN